mmetsp:Transcript_8192/g.14884  ORF Transcript_8192/g.14884 Transcript_8192/m.14884 type:complete len:652 (-) Transcript_8192:17-1972(-)
MVPHPSFFGLLVLLGLLSITDPAQAYRSKGTVDTLNSWNFIDRFCFIPHNYDSNGAGEALTLEQASNYGLFQYSFKFPDHLDLHMLVYYQKEGYDSWDSKGWDSVYVDEDKYPEQVLTCSERYYHATAKFRLRTQKNSDLIETRSDKNRVVSGFVYFKATSPKYFFVAVSNCNPSCTCNPLAQSCDYNATNSIKFCDGPAVFDYDFEFTNGKKLDYKHFGYDEIGCLAISWIFCIFYVLLVFLANVTVKNNLKKIDKYHITVKMVIWSIWISFVASVLRLYHYLLYSSDGIGHKPAMLTSSILASIAEILLVLHLILIAKGWTIVRRKISASGRVKIAAFITVYGVLHVTTTIFAEVFMDKGKIVFIYESPPGIVLQYTRLFAALWFARSINTTMTQFPTNKRRFYRKYTFIFGFWFSWMVLNTWISMSIPDYLRFKFSMAFELCCIFSAHFILAVMYNPVFSAASSFPFHSNASHEVMTGRWNSDAFKKEVNRPGIRSPVKRREARDDGFKDDRGGPGVGAIGQPTSPSQFADAPGAAPSNPAPLQQQQPFLGAAAAAPGQGSFVTSTPPKPKPQYAFSTVAEATGYVRDASDDVSSLLHQLITHLDTLDDAMDDWDDDVGEEQGEVYGDLGQDDRPWESRRGDERGLHR